MQRLEQNGQVFHELCVGLVVEHWAWLSSNYENCVKPLSRALFRAVIMELASFGGPFLLGWKGVVLGLVCFHFSLNLSLHLLDYFWSISSPTVVTFRNMNTTGHNSHWYLNVFTLWLMVPRCSARQKPCRLPCQIHIPVYFPSRALDLECEDQWAMSSSCLKAFRVYTVAQPSTYVSL